MRKSLSNKYTLLSFALLTQFAQSQHLISSFHVKNNDGQKVTFTYNSDGMRNQGVSGFTVFHHDGYKFEVIRDEKGALSEVRHDDGKVTFIPAEEDWAKVDPNAFTIVISKADGKLIRKTTYAGIKVNEAMELHTRSVYLGDNITQNGIPLNTGDVDVVKMENPIKGTSIVWKGKEIKGEAIFTKKNTKIREIEVHNHKVIRIIDEVRHGKAMPWMKTKDEVTESKLIGDRNVDTEWVDVRKVTDPDGESLVEEWEYYPPVKEKKGNEDEYASSLRVKRYKEPDGTETFYQYKQRQTIKDIRAPGQPEIRITNAFDILTKEKFQITERDGKEVLKVMTKYEPTRTTTTTTTPNSEEVLIEDFYPGGKMFGGKTKRVIRPDGSISTYEYTELPEQKIKLVTEHGKGDGEKVVKGTRQTKLFNKKYQLLESDTEEFDLTGK